MAGCYRAYGVSASVVRTWVLALGAWGGRRRWAWRCEPGGEVIAAHAPSARSPSWILQVLRTYRLSLDPLGTYSITVLLRAPALSWTLDSRTPTTAQRLLPAPDPSPSRPEPSFRPRPPRGLHLAHGHVHAASTANLFILTCLSAAE